MACGKSQGEKYTPRRAIMSSVPENASPSRPAAKSRRWLLPREHGAYGQLGFPLVCALSIGTTRPGALGLALSALLLFLAHEPLTVLRGERGQRRLDVEGRRARWQLALWTSLGLATGLLALYASRDSLAWAFAVVPASLGVLGTIMLLRGRERTTFGEVVIALAFASTALPVAAASAVPMRSVVLVGASWGVVSSLHVLAVRGLIARGRANGSPHYAAVVTGIAAAVFAVTALAVSLGVCPPAGLLAIGPAVVVAGAYFAWPPPLRKLATVGWTLMASSTATIVALVWLAQR